VLAAVKIAPFGDGLSLVRELDDPRVPGRGYPGWQTPSPGTAGTSARGGKLRLFAKHAQGADALAHDIKLLLDAG
jgi:hypothetical protein